MNSAANLLLRLFYMAVVSMLGNGNFALEISKRDVCSETLVSCQELAEPYSEGGLWNFAKHLHMGSIEKQCHDFQQILNCFKSVAFDEACQEHFSQAKKDMVLKYESLLKYVCVHKIIDINAQLGCFQNSQFNVGIRQCVLENMTPKALTSCDVTQFLECSREALNKLADCQQGAAELITELTERFIKMTPGCEDSKMLSQLLNEFNFNS